MIFSAAALAKIVATAEKSLAPDHMQRLGHDLDRAIRRFATNAAMGPAQPWDAYWKRGDEYIRAARVFAVVHSRGDKPGRWWRKQLRHYPDLLKVVQDYERLVRKLMDERLSPEQNPVSFGKRSALESLSGALQELVADLAAIYECNFGEEPVAWRSPADPDITSSFVAFVLAVLDKARIRDEHRKRRPFKAGTIIRHFRTVMPKTKK